MPSLNLIRRSENRTSRHAPKTSENSGPEEDGPAPSNPPGVKQRSVRRSNRSGSGQGGQTGLGSWVSYLISKASSASNLTSRPTAAPPDSSGARKRVDHGARNTRAGDQLPDSSPSSLITSFGVSSASGSGSTPVDACLYSNERGSSSDQNKFDESEIWSPSCYNVFKLLFSIRLTGALWSVISDCDETYNYWEPLHLLLYGSGFQTWEYSPVYALRSWSYVWIHYLPMKLYHILLPSATKITTFFCLRCLLSICCAFGEASLYGSIREKMSRNVARYFFVFTILSPGMFHAAPAFLPSSFSMTCNMLAMALWLRSQYFGAVFMTAVSALVGWPFAAVLGFPIVMDLLVQKRDYYTFFSNAGFSGLMVGVAMLQLDSYFYGRSVFPPLNLVLYNIFSPHGPDLYGTEPLSYYLVNCLLNTNIASLLALFAFPVTFGVYWLVYYRPSRYGAVRSSSRAATGFGPDGLSRYGAGSLRHSPSFMDVHAGYLPVFYLLSSLWLWIIIFFRQPHKEERFLFPIYPLFGLAAGLTLDGLERIWHFCSRNKWGTKFSIFRSTTLLSVFYGFLLATTVTLFVSRTFAVYKNYHAPFDVFVELGKTAKLGESGWASSFLNPEHPGVDKDPIRNSAKSLDSRFHGTQRVCIGKEWYRYPTSFFLPNSVELINATNNVAQMTPVKFELAFIKSEFAGLLPKPYPTSGGMRVPEVTRSIPDGMNLANREEMDRYVNLTTCDWLVDFSVPGLAHSASEPDFASELVNWELIKSEPFLYAAGSNRVLRAFYFKGLSEKYCTYGQYVLLKRKSNHPEVEKHDGGEAETLVSDVDGDSDESTFED